MKRKNIIWIISVGLMVLLAGIYLSGLKNKQTDISNSLRLVPIDANMLVEIREPFKLIDFLQTEPAFWKDLVTVPAFTKLNHNMIWLDSISSNHDVLHELLMHNSLLISVHDIGKRNLGSLFIIEIPDHIKTKSVLKDIDELLTDHDIRNRNYEGVPVYDVKTSQGNIYSYSIFKGNLFLCNNGLLIEDAIRQCDLDMSILNNSGFKDVYETAGKKELANIYVNMSRLNYLMSPFLKDDIENNHPALKNYASWVELDMSLSESLITLNGFAVAPDTTINYLSHIKDQPAVRNDFENILPENTALSYIISLDDNDKFSSYRRLFFEEHEYANYFDEQIRNFEQTCGSDFAEMLYSLIDNQVCYAIANINQLDIFQNSYILMNTKSGAKAEKLVRSFLDDYVKHTEQDTAEYISSMKLDAANVFTVYRMPLDDWPEVLLGSFFRSSKPKYCSILDNTLVFAPSKSALHKLFNNYLLNRSLSKNKNYLYFKKNLSREYQTYLYVNVSKAFEWVLHVLNDNYSDKLSGVENVTKNFKHFALQQIISDEMVYHNLAIQYSNYQDEKPHTIWESRLDTSIRTKPVLVENHYTRLKEICVQDVGNTIYLINHKGHVLWKLPLDEKILGDVHQVDAFQNGNLQYLFNTENKIYLIDRLGNHVERFPVNLRSPANCGLALFDYDNTCDYRIFVPCANKKVYLYNIEGNVVSGWDFEGAEYPVTQTPKYFRHGDKDYIVFSDKYRIYILNRRGEARVQPKYHFQTSKHNNFYYEKNKKKSESCFVTTSNTGTVMKVFLNSVVDSLHIKNYSKNHYFMLEDLDADGVKDYIFLDGKKLEVYSQGLSMIMSYEFDNIITEAPNYYEFSSDNHKLGVTDYKNKIIYLINADGTLHPGFPLTGKSPFSITSLTPGKKRFNLFVGGKDNFLYNYEIK
jgi:hypothetical protein